MFGGKASSGRRQEVLGARDTHEPARCKHTSGAGGSACAGFPAARQQNFGSRLAGRKPRVCVCARWAPSKPPLPSGIEIPSVHLSPCPETIGRFMGCCQDSLCSTPQLRTKSTLRGFGCLKKSILRLKTRFLGFSSQLQARFKVQLDSKRA